MSHIKRTERGWCGHFIAARDCLFRRNTLLECCNVKIVVSTVGLLEHPETHRFMKLTAFGAYFETMAFYSKDDDTRYHDADITKPIYLETNCYLDLLDADDKANEMHEAAVTEIMRKLRLKVPLLTQYSKAGKSKE